MATPEARLADAERAFKFAHQRVNSSRSIIFIATA